MPTTCGSTTAFSCFLTIKIKFSVSSSSETHVVVVSCFDVIRVVLISSSCCSSGQLSIVYLSSLVLPPPALSLLHPLSLFSSSSCQPAPRSLCHPDLPFFFVVSFRMFKVFVTFVGTFSRSISHHPLLLRRSLSRSARVLLPLTLPIKQLRACSFSFRFFVSNHSLFVSLRK